MTDPYDWQQEGAERDAIMAARRGGAFPPGVLDAYIARQRRRHALMPAEIEEALGEDRQRHRQ
ncbi:MAG: hypothetical protein A2882_09000 [Phenylobacterium sp. RIFCSPHIGHO2_01_FULL_70_10]|nr:MAG: hypothetical protein A2882_09000 [Phenylobacterium sp. RIFCSPHIGHO2_01_FULL_70_10]